MATSPAAPLSHHHVFLGDEHRRNERKVWLVILLTAAMMVVEIGAGAWYGSMALVADGWHMATHAGAMLISAVAYGYARRHASDPRFTFGTGKLGDLAAFASAVILALVALLIGWESFLRLADPVAISFEQAIGVAVVGLVVNLVSAWLLHDSDGHGHGHPHGHGHAHAHGHPHHDHGHGHRHRHGGHGHSDHDHHDHAGHDHHPHRHGQDATRQDRPVRDNNLRAAYLHVLADALTSILAIAALLVGRSYGWLWADPLMGLVGSLVIARWSIGLLKDSGRVLLDADPQDVRLRTEIRAAIETDADRITDLHVWRIGPGHAAAIVALSARVPRAPSDYKARLSHIRELSHLTVEVEPG